MTPEEFQAQFNKILTDYAGSSSNKKRKALELLNSGLNIGGSLLDLGISRKQISESERLQAGLSKPSVYNPVRDTQLLDSRVADAQKNIGDVRQDLAPAELANLDQYLKDIGNARIASGGQASLFGSMGNAAALRRRRGGLEIAALGSNIKRKNRSELNSLVGMDLQDQRAFERSKLAQSGLNLEQYNLEAAEAAALGSAGRLNQRNSIQGMLPNISGLAGTLQGMNFGSPFARNRGQRQAARQIRRQVPVMDFNDASLGSPGMNAMFREELDQGLNNIFNNRDVLRQGTLA